MVQYQTAAAHGLGTVVLDYYNNSFMYNYNII